jgi:hypothetical protein
MSMRVELVTVAVVAVVVDVISVVKTVLTVEVLRLVTVRVLVTEEAAREQAAVTMLAGYLLSTDG